jgi:hypothetical protein
MGAKTLSLRQKDDKLPLPVIPKDQKYSPFSSAVIRERLNPDARPPHVGANRPIYAIRAKGFHRIDRTDLLQVKLNVTKGQFVSLRPGKARTPLRARVLPVDGGTG